MSGALTADVIVDRVRSICAGPSFGLTEAASWADFDLQPSTNIDAVFRISPPSSQFTEGQFDFAEDRRDQLQIWLARRRNGDYDAVRRALLQDVHSLTAAVVRDGAVTSGDYDIPDGGRGHQITEDSGQGLRHPPADPAGQLRGSALGAEGADDHARDYRPGNERVGVRRSSPPTRGASPPPSRRAPVHGRRRAEASAVVRRGQVLRRNLPRAVRHRGHAALSI
jgi:hypothetical protein